MAKKTLKEKSQPVDPLILAHGSYLRHERGRGELTVDAYAHDLELFGSFLRYGSKKPPKEDNPERKAWPELKTAKTRDVRMFIQDLSGRRSYSMKAVRRKLSSITSFYKYLKFEGLREDNPAADIPAPKIPKPVPKPLEISAVSKLLRTRVADRDPARQARDHAIMELLYASGIRRAEVARIDLTDTDLPSRSIYIHGKGNKERRVLINNAAAEAIERYLRYRPRSNDPALFLGRTGSRLTPRHIWQIFKEIYNISGIKANASPHSLRHSFATHLINAGVDIVTVQHLMGHESVATTQMYTKVSLTKVRREYDAAHPRDRMKLR